MRKLITCLSVMGLLIVAACSPTTGTLPPWNGTVPAVGAITTLDEKTMLGVERTAIALNEAASAAVDAKLLVAGSPRAVQVADLLDDVRQAVLLARQAYDAGDGATAAARANSALALIGQAYRIIGG